MIDHGDHQKYSFRFGLDCYWHFYFSSSSLGPNVSVVAHSDHSWQWEVQAM
jgi:hypothetical protein